MEKEAKEEKVAKPSVERTRSTHTAVPMPPLPANEVLRHGHEAKKPELFRERNLGGNLRTAPLLPIRSYAGGFGGKLGFFTRRG